MNCQQFQNCLFEYLDGTLSAEVRMSAEKHLAECRGCGEELRRYQAFGQRLSREFRQATEVVQLSPEAKARMVSALQDQCCAVPRAGKIVPLWHRVMWPWAVAASLALVGVLLHFLGQSHPNTRESNGGPISATVSIEVSYPVPTYTFRREGAYVTDSLDFETSEVRSRY